jgi:hypothetical protein
MNKLYPYLLLSLCVLISCKDDDSTLFTKLSSSKTNIEFKNSLEETIDLNIFSYDYLYNGAGVSAGDVNNDGLPDLYFSGNTVENKLYLNTGELTFNDITSDAQVKGKKGWKTGVTMADVNADGWLDIYVCYAGVKEMDRSNELFINNGLNEEGIPTFTEKAKEYGIDAVGMYSTQAYFFDYDQDGDLDMFLLNHGLDYHSSFENAIQRKNERHPEYGNKLYKNNDGHFVDVSDVAGIDGGWLNYGLSVSISDFNDDGYPDLYVSNDFDERDFFYLNNGDGTFHEALKECFGHISKFTMGSDAADFNNDNHPDLVTLDMLPEDNYRQKLLKGPDGFDKYNYFLGRGFHKQQMRNMLHLNRGLDKKGLPVFSEIGQLSGIANTDWSWASLFADFDNDGNKDLFITNGYLRDFTNLDFQKYDFDQARKVFLFEGKDLASPEGKKFIFEYVNKMSSIKVGNYIFRNNGNLQFENKSKEWGLTEQTLTNGAAYADLDNDGDLDLIVNNLNDKAQIFRNNADKLYQKNHFLKIKLVGDKHNTLAVGAKVYLKTGQQQQFLEAHTNRGFLSSVDHTLHFGLGESKTLTEVKIIWTDGKSTTMQNVRTDTTLVIEYRKASDRGIPNGVAKEKNDKPLFSDITDSVAIDFIHKENQYHDYKSERLLLFQLSKQGPKMSVGDVNNDGHDDFFIGGASGQSGKLFLQKANGAFQPSAVQPWEQDKNCEDVASLFFDCDGDGDLDLFVVSGGNEYAVESPTYQDRLYINNGKGIFSKASGGLPNRVGGGSCVVSADIDHDGDIDLFVGGWVLPSSFPKCSSSRILLNESTSGVLSFKDVTKKMCPALQEVGMLHDARWSDVDNDGWADLVLAGDWMPITVFKNAGGSALVDITEEVGLAKTNGFWNSVMAGDFDNDGDTDFIAGNIGRNSELSASEKFPLEMYYHDFDQDGKIDPIVCNYSGGISYPIATRDELLSQIAFLKKKFVRYSQYANAKIGDILDSAQMAKAEKKQIFQLQSCYIENVGNAKFKLKPLPLEAQFAPIQSIIKGHFNEDTIEDILIAGNLYSYRAEYGPFDASIGLLLLGDGKGSFIPVHRNKSGLLLTGDTRHIVQLKNSNGNLLLVASKNNEGVQIFRYR